MLKINLGCGPDIREGWENLDKWAFDPAVKAVDLEEAKLPYPNDSADEMRATHVLEHVFNFPALLNECHRVLAPGGIIYIEVPKFPHNDSVKDPTHVRFFVEETFLYFTKYLQEGIFKMYEFKPWKLLEMHSDYADRQISVRMEVIK